jgi:hypothetical protein
VIDQHGSRPPARPRAPRPSSPRRLKRRREALAQKAILAALELKGCIAVRVNSGTIVLPDPVTGKKRVVRLARRGTSDVLAGVPMQVELASGRSATLLVFAAVECKAQGEEPSDDQAAFLDDVRARGGMSIVARGLDDVERLLRAVARASEATRANPRT